MEIPAVSWERVSDHLLHLAIAFVLTAPLAWDREQASRGPGLRTFPLVATGSCALEAHETPHEGR